MSRRAVASSGRTLGRTAGLDLTKHIPSQLYGILRQLIVDNTLEPGERIAESSLAQECGVSLTPLRAAMQQLAADGLVFVRPQVGTLVTSLDIEQLNEAVFIRAALECAVAEKLVSGTVDFSQLDLMLAQQAGAAETDDFARFFRLEESFYAKLAELAGKPTT